MAKPATYGFWRGALAGLVVAAAGALALAWVYPPRPLLAPEVDPGALEAPAAPGQPAGWPRRNRHDRADAGAGAGEAAIGDARRPTYRARRGGLHRRATMFQTRLRCGQDCEP